MELHFPNESIEYRAARKALLEQEIALRRQMESVAAARRALPEGGVVKEDYVFDGLDADGNPAKVSLSELFRPGTHSLLIYNMMFPRHKSDERPQPATGAMASLPREDTPCPSCTGLLDQLNAAARHFEAAGYSFAVVAKAPLQRVLDFARDRGWNNLHMLSCESNSFKEDYNAVFEDGQLAPMSHVFRRSDDGRVSHFWSSEMLFAETDPGQDPRQQGTIEPLWNMMDLMPEGRPDFDEQMQYGDNACCHGPS